MPLIHCDSSGIIRYTMADTPVLLPAAASLLGLPAELRETIYHVVLLDLVIPIRQLQPSLNKWLCYLWRSTSTPKPTERTARDRLPLLFTCKQITSDITPCMLSNIVLDIQHPSSFPYNHSILHTLPLPPQLNLKTLCLQDQHYRSLQLAALSNPFKFSSLEFIVLYFSGTFRSASFNSSTHTAVFRYLPHSYSHPASHSKNQVFTLNLKWYFTAFPRLQTLEVEMPWSRKELDLSYNIHEYKTFRTYGTYLASIQRDEQDNGEYDITVDILPMGCA